MKIFGVALNGIQHNKAEETALYTEMPFTLFTKMDSALTKGGKPFFVPDHLGQVSQEACLVVRLNRFGKSVPPRFAHRYWDAITIGVDFTATDLLHRLRNEAQPWDLAKSMDGSLPIGEWIEKADLDADASLQLLCDGMPLQEIPLAAILPHIDQTVASISHFFTLKTGDLLFINIGPQPTEARINSHLDGFVGNKHLLSVNVK